MNGVRQNGLGARFFFGDLATEQVGDTFLSHQHQGQPQHTTHILLLATAYHFTETRYRADTGDNGAEDLGTR